MSALRSQSGASYELLRLLREAKWTLVLSNTVLGEYHEVLHREAGVLRLAHSDADEYLDVLCALAEQQRLTREWQPAASDPDDEPLVQLAREAGVPYLVTHNVRDVRARRSLECGCCARQNSWKFYERTYDEN